MSGCYRTKEHSPFTIPTSNVRILHMTRSVWRCQLSETNDCICCSQLDTSMSEATPGNGIPCSTYLNLDDILFSHFSLCIEEKIASYFCFCYVIYVFTSIPMTCARVTQAIFTYPHIDYK